jgi:hypothetical protein
MYPSNWIIEELNEKFGEGTSAPMTGLANFNPDTPESYKSTIESEAWDISKYPDKSIEGIAESEKDYVHLSPDASIEEAKRIESISGLPAYRTIYTQSFPDSEEIWKIMETYIVSGADMEYVIRFTATDNESYDRYISVVDNIVKSVIIDGSKTC